MLLNIKESVLSGKYNTTLVILLSNHPEVLTIYYD